MSRRRRALSLLVVAVSACGPAGELPKTPRQVATGAPIDAPKEHAQYVLAQAGQRAATSRVALPGGGVGFIETSARFTLDAKGKVTGTSPRTESLSRVEAIPQWLGGGFLFHGSDALFRADDFLGELRPIATSSSGFSSVTMGPASALVVTGDGVRYALELSTGKRSRVEPRGASVYGGVSGSRGVAITDGGFAYLTTDAGKTWSTLKPKLLGAPVDVVVEDADLTVPTSTRKLFLIEDSGGALRVDEAGVERAAVGPKQKAPERVLSSRGEPFLDLALKVGAPLDDPERPTEAIVPDAGGLYTVSLETGEVFSVARGVLPPDLPCQAERLSNEILFLCRQSNRAVVASRPLLGEKVTLEASFTTSGTFVRGGGDTLLYTGPCHGEATKPGQACVRVPRSDAVEAALWADLDRSAELSDADPKKPISILTWVPSDKGAIIALGGAEGGLLDTRGHTRSRLAEDDTRKLAQVFQTNGNELVERRFRVLDDGTIEGWNMNGVGVRVTEGGKTITQSAFSFPGARIAGPRALALSPQNALWQSLDWGQTFVEVASPTLIGSPPSPRDCSAVGCNLGEWLRVGWEARAPLPSPAQAPPARRVVPSEPLPILPSLSCASSGALVRKAIPTPPSARLGFGAKPFPASDRGPILRVTFARSVPGPWTAFDSPSLRALLGGRQPELAADGTARLTDAGTDRQISFVEAFDPKAIEKHASIKLDALVASVTSQGGTPPDLSSEEEVGSALPVLSDSGGLLLSGMGGPPLWVRDKRVTPLTFGAEDSSLSITSAVETKPEGVVLALDTDGTSHARRLGRGMAEELFSIPAPTSNAQPQTPDVLATASDGTFAVLRFPSASPPTQESPAYLLRPAHEPVALAPWSTVASSDSPACADGKGYRAIVAARRSWLALEAGQPQEDHVSIMRVRWSEERVCLEAIEAGGLTHDLPAGSFESYVVARFGKDAAAGHVLVGAGAELREPRSCTVSAATR